MHKLNGVQVDYYAVDDQDEDGFTTTSYFPIYEYEYGGIKQQLRCDYGESGKRYSNTGRRVHILIDPQTGKAVCLEDETKNQSILLVFGGIGIVAFVLVLVVWFGKLY